MHSSNAHGQGYTAKSFYCHAIHVTTPESLALLARHTEHQVPFALVPLPLFKSQRVDRKRVGVRVISEEEFATMIEG
jgi:hypothetical protein